MTEDQKTIPNPQPSVDVLGSVEAHKLVDTQKRPESYQSIVFNSTIDSIVDRGLDLNDKQRERIVGAGEKLIGDYELTEEFFQDPTRAALFVTVADRFATEQDQGEKGITKEVLTLLAGGHSNQEDAFDKARRSEGPDEIAAYDRFTNKEVSKDLSEAIKQRGLLDGVRKKLGIEEDDEFEVRVLNVTSESGGESYGMKPTLIDEDYDRWTEETALFEHYERGLVKNSTDFYNKLQREGSFASAWVTRVDDKTLLCLPLPTAEKIAYPEEERSKYYTDADIEREIATLQHEYVHTQRMLTVDNRADIGIGLEELRAEHLSGNRQGYMDVKKYFLGDRLFFNRDIRQFDGSDDELGFRSGDYYEGLIAEVGTEAALEMALVFPTNYVNDEKANPLVKSINEKVGGLEGLQSRMYDRAVAELGEDTVKSNILSILSKVTNPAILWEVGPFSFVTKKIQEVWEEQQEIEIPAESN